MCIRTHRSYPYLTALMGVMLLALCFFVGLCGVSVADEPGQPADDRPVKTIQAPGANSTGETDREDQVETSDGDEQVRTKSGRTLTIRQKRIFVLGLGAGQKN